MRRQVNASSKVVAVVEKTKLEVSYRFLILFSLFIDASKIVVGLNVGLGAVSGLNVKFNSFIRVLLLFSDSSKRNQSFRRIRVEFKSFLNVLLCLSNFSLVSKQNIT